jgi:1,4-alpha-glucan branching enzyme
MAKQKPSVLVAKPVHKRISFVFHHDHAKDVVITGDFTGWSDDGVRLTKEPSGEWQTVLQLSPGEHQYRLRVEGLGGSSQGREAGAPSVRH